MKTPAHEFWLHPTKKNHPLTYLMAARNRAPYLRDKLAIHFTYLDDPTVLEVGCNSGRNLLQLAVDGYSVAGVEINPEAVELMHSLYPTEGWDIRVGPASETLPEMEPRDIVFSMAVLEHIHPDEIDVVLDEMTRLAAVGIVTIEAEDADTERHWPRNYQGLIECRGFEQIHEEAAPDVIEIDLGGFTTRIFRRETDNPI